MARRGRRHSGEKTQEAMVLAEQAAAFITNNSSPQDHIDTRIYRLVDSIFCQIEYDSKTIHSRFGTSKKPSDDPTSQSTATATKKLPIKLPVTTMKVLEDSRELLPTSFAIMAMTMLRGLMTNPHGRKRKMEEDREGQGGEKGEGEVEVVAVKKRKKTAKQVEREMEERALVEEEAYVSAAHHIFVTGLNPRKPSEESRRRMERYGLSGDTDGMNNELLHVAVAQLARVYYRLSAPNVAVRPMTDVSTGSVQLGVMATRTFKPHEEIQGFRGLLVKLSKDEDEKLIELGLDFSVVGGLNQTSLLLGPGHLVNHSCKPNAEFRTHENGIITFVATRRIECGEEVRIHYGPTYFKGIKGGCLCESCRSSRLTDLESGLRKSAVKERMRFQDEGLRKAERGRTAQKRAEYLAALKAKQKEFEAEALRKEERIGKVEKAGGV
ncbi:hypothetical protein YB2330_003963 [Saitoella coloradoensis]